MREYKTVIAIAVVAALGGFAVWMLLSQHPGITVVSNDSPPPPSTGGEELVSKSPQQQHTQQQDPPKIKGPDLSKLGSISGRVVSGGLGVEDVLVQALMGRRVVASSRSDAEGNFTIRYLAAGTYSLSAKKAGFADARVENVRLGEAERLTGVLIEMERAGMIEGRVLDESGEGVSGALIYAWLHEGGRVLRTFRTAADEQGRFRFDNLPQGDYRLRANAEGFVNENRIEETTVVSGQTSEVNLMLRRGATISGLVTNEAGDPVPKARLTLAKTDGTAIFAHSSFTDKNGSFKLSGLPEGTFKLKVWHNDYLPHDAGPFTLRPSDEVNDVRIILSTGLTLKGVVVDSEGNPLKGITVSATCRNPYLYRNAVTDKDGRFQIKGLYDAPLSISATAAGKHFLPWIRHNIHPTMGPIRIVLTKGATLIGDLNTDSPPKKYQILLYRLQNGKKRFAKQFFLDGDTHFVVSGIEPGRYAVKARARGYSDSPEEVVDLSSGQGYVLLTLRKK